MKKMIICFFLGLTLAVTPILCGSARAVDDYPERYKSAGKDALVDEWRFYNRECVSFVAWCLNSRNHANFTNFMGDVQWGNGSHWGAAARALGYTVDMNPTVGSVAWWGGGNGNHVAWVSAVNGSSVTIEEYNFSGNGTYHTRVINVSEPSGYIHILDLDGAYVPDDPTDTTPADATAPVGQDVTRVPATVPESDGDADPAGVLGGYPMAELPAVEETPTPDEFLEIPEIPVETATPVTTYTVSVTTAEASDVTSTSAVLSGTAISGGGLVTECGMYFGEDAENLTLLGSDVADGAAVALWYSTERCGRALVPDTTYYFMAYAVTGGQTWLGDVQSFTTPAAYSSVTVHTGAAEEVTGSDAVLFGSVYADKSTVTECGIYLGTAPDRMERIGYDRVSGKAATMWYNTADCGSVLTPGTTYYYRAYAVSGGATRWGETETFTTPGAGNASGNVIYAMSDNHQHSLLLIPYTAPDCETPGNLECWICTECGTYFTDREGKNEITREDVILPTLGHYFSNGVCLRCGATVLDVHLDRSRDYAQNQFLDVAPGAWYANAVADAYEFGLMQGVEGGLFNPGGEITIAEAVTMAARLHSIYATGGEHFSQSVGGAWYQTYLDYAYLNGIIGENIYTNVDPTRKATRAEFSEIFAGALPEAALAPVNTVADGSISDVPDGLEYARSIYLLYRAGILTGDETGAFRPYKTVTRAEAAAIVSRMAESSSRVALAAKK